MFWLQSSSSSSKSDKVSWMFDFFFFFLLSHYWIVCLNLSLLILRLQCLIFAYFGEKNLQKSLKELYIIFIFFHQYVSHVYQLGSIKNVYLPVLTYKTQLLLIIVVKNSDSQLIQHNIQDIYNIPTISAVMMINLFSNAFLAENISINRLKSAMINFVIPDVWWTACCSCCCFFC